jgi:hypothetical protein
VEVGHDLDVAAPRRQPLALHADPERWGGDADALRRLPEEGSRRRVAAALRHEDEAGLPELPLMTRRPWCNDGVDLGPTRKCDKEPLLREVLAGLHERLELG